MSISILPASAQVETSNQHGSLKIEQEVFEIKPHETITFKISGNINDVLGGARLSVVISDPEGITTGLQLTPTDKGYFETYSLLNNESLRGQYEVSASYHTYSLGSVFFTLKEIEFSKQDLYEARNIPQESESITFTTSTPLQAKISVTVGSAVPGCEETKSCFSPFHAKVGLGSTVTWSNDDSAAHTVTSGTASNGPDGTFDSSLFLAGTTFEHTFDEAGTYDYFCMVHPWMNGVVNVSDISSQSEPEPTPAPTPESVCGTGFILDGENCVIDVNAYRKTHIENFPDSLKSPNYYVERYQNEEEYSNWFNSHFTEKTILEVVGYKKTHIDNFPDNNQSPYFYIQRYYVEEEYKTWYDENFDEPVSSILGINGEDTATLIAKIADQFRKKYQFEKAQFMTNTALSFDSENIDALYQIGLIQWERGYLNQAKPIFEKIIVLDPNNVNATTAYGDILLEENNLEFALIYYERALENEPDDLYGLTGKGTVMLLQGNSEGMSYIDDAIRLYPDSAAGYSSKAWALDELGNFDEALFYYNKALEIDPDNTWNWNDVGYMLMQQGKYDEAIPYFEKSLEIWPENEYAKNNLQDALAQTIIKDQKSEVTDIPPKEISKQNSNLWVKYDVSFSSDSNNPLVGSSRDFTLSSNFLPLAGSNYFERDVQFIKVEFFDISSSSYTTKIYYVKYDNSEEFIEEQTLSKSDSLFVIDPNVKIGDSLKIIDMDLTVKEFSTLLVSGKEIDVIKATKELTISNPGSIGEVSVSALYHKDTGILLLVDVEATVRGGGQYFDMSMLLNAVDVSDPLLQKSSESIGGGCLIATATFGSELAPQVQMLREIRDNSLLQTQSGQSFMKSFNSFYYSFSPTIADLERENPVFKEAVKLTITPLLASLSLLNYADLDSEESVLGYGIGIILMNVGMYFVAPVIVIHRIKKILNS